MHVAGQVYKMVDVHTHVFMHTGLSSCSQVLHRELAR